MAVVLASRLTWFEKLEPMEVHRSFIIYILEVGHLSFMYTIRPFCLSERGANIIVAEKTKRYLSVAFCKGDPEQSTSSVSQLITYRYDGYPELTDAELQEMHEEIKTNLGIDQLRPGKLHCSGRDSSRRPH
jgi:hypothetical protein